MNYRSVLLVGALIGSGALAASAACSSPDPAAITYATRASTSGGEPQGTSSSSGASGPTDAGPPAPPPPDPIFGTTAFAYVDPGVTANNADPAHEGSVEGKNCVVTGCHLDVKPWVFAGTLYTGPDGGATVAKGEIKILGPNGVEIGTTYTDANGNFWLDKAGTTIPAGSKVGVRREGGAAPRNMATGLQPTDSGCSKGGTCHGGQTGKVYAD